MKFSGFWHITNMEMWDEAYINMEKQAYLKIKPDGLGGFQFGLVAGQIDGKVEKIGNQDRFAFTWAGSDELEPVSGSGWVKLNGTNILIGKIKIHLGDESSFEAIRTK